MLLIIQVLLLKTPLCFYDYPFMDVFWLVEARNLFQVFNGMLGMVLLE